MSLHLKAALAASATGMLVGAGLVSSKTVADAASPASLAFLRYLVGLMVFVIPLVYGRRTRFSVRDFGAIAALGIFQFGVLMLLLNYALTKLSATTCALVFSTMPLFTMCLAIVSKREAYAHTKLVGLTLAVGGVAYLLSAPSEQVAAHESSLLGFAALIGATVTGAITSVLYRPYLGRYSALPTCSLAMGAAVIFLLLFCWSTAQPVIPSLNALQWANVIFIGLSSGVGYFCWLWALAKLEASRVVAFQALGPVTAAVIELGIGHRHLSFELVASLAMVAAGLSLAVRQASSSSAGSGEMGLRSDQASPQRHSEVVAEHHKR